MLLKSIVAAVILGAGSTNAFWRMQCGTPLVTDQIDPLVQPGIIPAKHVHNFMGGSGLDQHSTWESLQKSDCTSCQVKGDKSIYWVPVLYFRRESDGQFLAVKQKPGMLIYYLPEYGGDSVEVFPKGFKMVAGDPKLTNFTDAPINTEEYRRQKAIGFNCLNYNMQAEAFAARSKMPSNEQMRQCVDGLRADIQFPSCWNGELDSEDHRSHMAYPYDVVDGTCPESHPRRLITLKFETIFDVVDQRFEVPGQFVWSTGDPTGYAYHGDFVNGWDMGLLEDAVNDDSCVPPVITADGGVIERCNTFTSRNQLQDPYAMDKCVCKPKAKGDFYGPIPKLSGCNPIRDGSGLFSSNCDKADAPAPLPLIDLSHAKAKATTSTLAAPTTTMSVYLPPKPTTTRRRTRTRKPKPAPTTTTPVALPPVITPPAVIPPTLALPTPSVIIAANPVMQLGSGHAVVQAAAKEDKVANVVVTVVETVTRTVFDDSPVETVSLYQHRRRHHHRRDF